MIIEVCIDSVLNAIKAYHAGADILELCAHLDKDGLTPDVHTFQTINQEVNIPVKVMIRIDKPSFNYTDNEKNQMRQSVIQFSNMGATHFVFGALDAGGQVDLDVVAHMFENIKTDSLTFHKAVDYSNDLIAACKKINDSQLNISHILSSGGKSTAALGCEQLIEMKKILNPKTKLIAAGKITYENLEELHHKVQLEHYHGKRILNF